jgi:hypothetical protein
VIGTSLRAGVLCSMLGRVILRESGLTVLRLTLWRTLEQEQAMQAMRPPMGAPAESPFLSLGLLLGMGKDKNRLGQGRKDWSKTHLRCL